jgi:hypothetical protein
MALGPCPTVPTGLLRWLEAAFPDRLPDRPPSEAEAAELVGQQKVIRKLRAEHERQQNNILNTTK